MKIQRIRGVMETQGRIFLIVVGMLSFSWATAMAQQENFKVGHVNLSLVFDSYHKTKAFDQELEKDAEAKRKDREDLVTDIRKLRDELELLSPEKRTARQSAVDEKVAELQAFDKDSRQNLRQRRDEMIREILGEIDGVISQYGRERGYDYIFNDRVLVFKNETNDISQEIIKKLNE